MKMTKTTKFFFIYTLYLVVALGAYAFFYMHINGKSESISKITAEVSQLREQNLQMENLEQTIENTKEGREKLTSFFVDSNQIIEFLETIESMGAKTNVDVDVQSINETETDFAGIKTLTLNINFEGKWSNTHHFLVLLENLPIKLTVTRLTLKEQSLVEGEISPTWKGNIEFKSLEIDT